MRDFLSITTLLLTLLAPGSPQTMEAYNSTEEVEEEESFFSSMDFHSILIGVVGFWGGVFCMGLLYLLAVLAKRVFKPEEAEKGAE